MAKKKIKFDITAKITRVGGLTLGGISTGVVNKKLIPMVLKNADAKVSNGITLGIGALLPEGLGMISPDLGQSNFIQAIADGMVAVSGMQLAEALAPDVFAKLYAPAPVKGLGYAGSEGDYFVAGPDYMDVDGALVTGSDDLSAATVTGTY